MTIGRLMSMTAVYMITGLAIRLIIVFILALYWYKKYGDRAYGAVTQMNDQIFTAIKVDKKRCVCATIAEHVFWVFTLPDTINTMWNTIEQYVEDHREES